jgi:carbon storage regulator
MLVLTRRPGESIIIGDGIKLTVVNVGPGRVKIGIDAPSHVRINREEIHARIQQEEHPEQSNDVLSVVSSNIASQGSQNTIVTSGSETSILHNRIADKLPAEAPPAAPTPEASEAASQSARLAKYRAPRKPR